MSLGPPVREGIELELGGWGGRGIRRWGRWAVIPVVVVQIHWFLTKVPHYSPWTSTRVNVCVRDREREGDRENEVNEVTSRQFVPVCQGVQLSVHISVHISISPSMRPFIHPSIHESVIPCRERRIGMVRGRDRPVSKVGLGEEGEERKEKERKEEGGGAGGGGGEGRREEREREQWRRRRR